jgi:alanyl-tRNA synthetase
MNSNLIRKTFFDFFKSKSHEIVKSAPMVLKDDPTLMFSNAGMNQFKDIFLGFENAKYLRIANSQKCLRVSGKHNDLEEVGVDTYHHTMFEMLGNWSFGDYFKKESIEWSWQLFIEKYQINPDQLYVTVFQGDKKDGTPFDQESYDIWKKLISEDRIIKCSKKDNFWEMGSQGPCGPSSEIHIDIRSEQERLSSSGKELVNKDHPHVIELWNLVFMEYNRTSKGVLEPLKNKHVDTGMGLERLAMVLQGKTSNYDSDVFSLLIKKLEKLSQFKYLTESNNAKQIKINIAIRVIVDHLRAVAFSITDGQLPSNTGAGYVIRRILRRAVRYGYQFLQFDEPFIFHLVDQLAVNFESVFDEIGNNKEFIKKIIFEEESSFFKTLSSGIKRLNEISQSSIKENKSIVPGKLAFELYDTYGFPIDLTKLIAIENNLSVDEKEFQEYLNQQKIRSKKDAVKDFGDWVILREDDVQEFIGYDHLSALVKITQYRSLNIKNKTIYQLIFNLTPFYPEGGGQVGDIGMIHNDQEKIRITDTKKENGAIVHYVETLPKNINASFTAQVDVNIRTKTIKNHSATHLLHYALRKVLGKHVEQKGSLVNSNNLRFDFSHFSKLTKKELFDVESEVNLQIRKAYPLQEDRNVPIEIAKQKGAMMLFGEKYGDSVRTIQFGESIELCGGIHVESSSLVGNFKLLSESSISSGIRRIEAVSDIDADQFVQDKLNEIDDISNLLKRPDNLVEAIQQLQKHNIELQKQLDLFIQSKILEIKRNILGEFIDMNEISFLYKELDISADQMKQIAFEIKAQLTNFVLVLTSVQNNKPLISVMISDNLVKEKNWNAGVIIRVLAKKIKGGGGGQAFFATAGGSDISGIKLVEDQAKEIFS